MGTITPRKRKDGSTGYKAQVRIKKDGKVVHQETETFDRKQVALAWIKRRETELSAPGALADTINPEPTLAQVITRYLEEIGAVKKIGRTKEMTLKQIAGTQLGTLKPSEIVSATLVDYARGRIMNDGVKPATVQNDLAILAPVFSIAHPAWGFKLDHAEMVKARAVSRQLGLTNRAAERSRVPSMDELERIMAHFHDAGRRRKWMVPMLKLVAFAIFSTRRQEEILRIRWEDLNEEDRTVLVRDVKHPTKKVGNDVWCKLPDEAWQLVQSMPKVDERIFPFTTDAVSAQFTRACDWLEIEDLRFHDLRRAGVTRLFEMGWDIPRVAQVSAHKDWNMMRRYTNLKGLGDRYEGWKWLPKAIEQQWVAGRKEGRPCP